MRKKDLFQKILDVSEEITKNSSKRSVDKILLMNCPHCEKGFLETVKANPPYTVEHYQCNKCDSTYNKE